MKKQLLSLAAAAALLVTAQSSFAGGSLPGDTTLNYSVILVGSCIAATVTQPAAFGTFGTLDSPQNNLPAGSVAVKCTNNYPVTLCVGGGDNYGSQLAATRSMSKDGLKVAPFVDYVLKNAANGALVGDSGCDDGFNGYTPETASDHQPVALTGTGATPGATAILTLVADVDPASSGDNEGTYTDKVAVSVIW